MKLINISKSGDTYVVKALHPVRILGIQIFSFVKIYRLSEDGNYWFEEKSKKKVSRYKIIKLEKWLKDHKKFIEKTEA